MGSAGKKDPTEFSTRQSAKLGMRLQMQNGNETHKEDKQGQQLAKHKSGKNNP